MCLSGTAQIFPSPPAPRNGLQEYEMPLTRPPTYVQATPLIFSRERAPAVLWKRGCLLPCAFVQECDQIYRGGTSEFESCIL